MFAIMDMAAETVTRPKTASDRACDQCKSRKVRCDMKRPCAVCSARAFQCTYDNARKKRGPVGKRIQAIRRSQEGRSESAHSGSFNNTHWRPRTSTSPEHNTNSERDLALHHTMSNASSRVSTSSFNSTPVQWTSDTAFPVETNTLTPIRSETIDSTFSARPLSTVEDATLASPSPSEFVFPSLPVESPPTAWDPFGTLLQQQQELSLPTSSLDLWPASISEERLMPWYDVYFKRLHPTIPILNRANLYHDLLLRKHHLDPQYGAMLLALCAFAMTQPVQIQERASMPSRSVQAQMLMEECAKLRMAPDFGENPTIEMVLTNFFMFAWSFGRGSRIAARLRLREAVDLAYAMGIHLPQSYEQLDEQTRELWIRTYLVLSVTERYISIYKMYVRAVCIDNSHRAYALQQRYSIDFRGRPGMTARFMQAFDTNTTSHNISGRLFHDSSDAAIGMVGLLYLMESFDAIDESVVDCWNGYCRLSDGICEAYDRRRALAMFRAQHKARDACTTGTVWLSPGITPLPLKELRETQRADIQVTQFWILNRLWNLSFSHDLLRVSSDHPELQYDYAYEIARAVLAACEELSLSAMEVHGVGLVEKLHDIGSGIIDALKASNGSTAAVINPSDLEYGSTHDAITVHDLLTKFQGLLLEFRGGDHPYNKTFSNSVNAVLFGDV